MTMTYGPLQKMFRSLKKRLEPGMSKGTYFVWMPTDEELKIMNGYVISTGDNSVHVKWSYDLRSVSFDSMAAVKRVAQFCRLKDNNMW